MTTKSGYVLKKVADTHIVVPVGNLDFNGVISLNETGVLIWNALEKGAEEKDLVAAILAEYNVKEEIAAADVKRFLAKMKEADLLE